MTTFNDAFFGGMIFQVYRKGGRGSAGMKEAIERVRERVREHMKRKYHVDLDDLEISDVPGYWKDKEPLMHKGHPLHSCLGCDGPLRATYTYHDHPRDHATGKFVSPYRTWRIIFNHARRQ